MDIVQKNLKENYNLYIYIYFFFLNLICFLNCHVFLRRILTVLENLDILGNYGMWKFL